MDLFDPNGGMVYRPTWEAAAQRARGKPAIWSGWIAKATERFFCQNKSKIDEQQMLFADAFAAYGRGSAAPYGEIMH